MSSKLVTVSDLAALIEAREETRSDLHALAVQAYEQWRALEAKIEELEKRLDRSYDELSGLQVGACVGGTSARRYAGPLSLTGAADTRCDGSGG